MDKHNLSDIFSTAVKAVEPFAAVKNMLKVTDGKLLLGEAVFCNLGDFDRILAVGAGKGTVPMAAAVEDILGGRLDDGIIIVKYGHTAFLERISQVEAGHPVPDDAGVAGSSEVIDMLRGADGKTLVICLLSGGGSALLVSPAEGLSLKDKQTTTDVLLKCGATIEELNTVRKHLSQVKGGRLARIAYPATILTLVLSDVIGDRLDVIASGPMVPDTTTFRDALMVVEKYALRERLPKNVVDFLERGAAGKIPDTPKSGEDCFRNASAVIVGSSGQALRAARDRAERLGFDTEVVTDTLQGEARDAAVYLAGVATKAQKHLSGGKPRCLVSGGETIVTVKGNGLGGRNQELALAFALEIDGLEGITLLSAGTDGTDGPTDAAGAMVDGKTAAVAKNLGIDPAEYLARNDSYSFFKKLDSLSGKKSHFITGPTGTNVMDIQVVAVNTA